ncbi:hypothetical protein BC831DRAFT_463090 [Entophlyctis helioformis]|nr:hypothetical protein BC831DRAFT_463090 [Entophlyctis helioformis]
MRAFKVADPVLVQLLKLPSWCCESCVRPCEIQSAKSGCQWPQRMPCCCQAWLEVAALQPVPWSSPRQLMPAWHPRQPEQRLQEHRSIAIHARVSRAMACLVRTRQRCRHEGMRLWALPS